MEYGIIGADLETITECPACAASQFGSIASAHAGDLCYLETVQCENCGLTFRATRPTTAWFGRSWDIRNEKPLVVGDPQAFLASLLEKRRFTRYAALAKFLKKHASGSNLLDVGCGPATGHLAFRKQGFETTGIEPDQQRAEVGRSVFGLNILPINIEQYSGSGDSYDVVTIIQALEHFHRPIAFLSSCIKPLRIGGLIYLEVPDARVFVNWRDALYLEHMQNFSESNLVGMASRLGLSAVARIHPKTQPFGYNHLGVLFRKETEISPVLMAMSQEDKDAIRDRYRVGLPRDARLPVRYNIEKITNVAISVPSAMRPRRLQDNVFTLRAGSSVADVFTQYGAGEAIANQAKVRVSRYFRDPAFESVEA